jgi:hypothetical protein
MNPCTEPKCKNESCCLNCVNYQSALEFIPTHLNIACKVQDKITLQIHSWPKRDGVLMKDCEYWRLK